MSFELDKEQTLDKVIMIIGAGILQAPAIKIAKGSLFACVDADSIVEKNSLRLMLPHFLDSKVGAVISAIKINKPKNIYEKVQRLEYIIAVLIRKLMESINTLSMTPGVLSVYKTDVLRKVGGFDSGNITEDYEIAMRLKYHKYKILIMNGKTLPDYPYLL